MELTLENDSAQDVLHVSITGQMTSQHTGDDQPNALETAIGDDWMKRTIVIDLSQVSYIDSTAIGWMVNAHRQMQQEGGRMVLHSLHPNVAQVFDLLKLERLFTVASDKASAQTQAAES